MTKSERLLPDSWVLLRGLTRGSFHWLDFDKKFKIFFHLKNVFILDLPGNGLKYKETSPTSLEVAVEQLRQQLPEKNMKIGIFSISMGGMIATRWAELYPEQVSHLVLVNSSFSNLSPFYHRLRPKNYLSIFKILFTYNPVKLEEFILQKTSNFKEKWHANFENFVALQKSHPVSISNFIRQLILSSSAQFTKKPKADIFILNSINDRLINSQCSEAIAKNWNVPIIRHPTAGHDLSLDDDDWILQTLKKYYFK